MIGFGGTHQAVGGLGYWQSANVWSGIAMKDHFAGTTTFAGQVLDAVGDTFGQFPAFRQNSYNDDTLVSKSLRISYVNNLLTHVCL